jgi:hypothetical protein
LKPTQADFSERQSALREKKCAEIVLTSPWLHFVLGVVVGVCVVIVIIARLLIVGSCGFPFVVLGGSDLLLLFGLE